MRIVLPVCLILCAVPAPAAPRPAAYLRVEILSVEESQRSPLCLDRTMNLRLIAQGLDFLDPYALRVVIGKYIPPTDSLLPVGLAEPARRDPSEDWRVTCEIGTAEGNSVRLRIAARIPTRQPWDMRKIHLIYRTPPGLPLVRPLAIPICSPKPYPYATVDSSALARARDRSGTYPDYLPNAESALSSGHEVNIAQGPGWGIRPPYENAVSDMEALAWGYAVSGDVRFARQAADMMWAFADQYYLFRARFDPLQPREMAYYIEQDASVLLKAVRAYELLRTYLDPTERARIEYEFFQQAAQLYADQRFNRGTSRWARNTALGCIGLALGDRELVDQALDARQGFRHHLGAYVNDDGLDGFEGLSGSGAHYGALLAMAAQRAGLNLWAVAAPDLTGFAADNGPKSLKLLFDANLHYTFPNGTQPGDTPTSLDFLPVQDSPWDSYIRRAADAYHRSLYDSLVRLLFARLQHKPTEPVPRPDRQFAPTGRTINGCTLFDSTGVAILRQAPATLDAVGVALYWGSPPPDEPDPGPVAMSLCGRGGHRVLTVSGLAYLDWPPPQRGSSCPPVNTVVVDQTVPGVPPPGRIRGQRVAFYAGRLGSMVRAVDQVSYPGVTLDRTVLLMEDTVLDVFRTSSETDHTYDYLLNPSTDAGVASPTLNWEAFAAPAEVLGYEDLTDVRYAQTDGAFTLEFGGAEGLALQCLGAPATDVLWANRGLQITKDTPPHKRPVLIIRRRGKAATFATVFWIRGQKDKAPMLKLDEQGKLILEPRQWKR